VTANSPIPTEVQQNRFLLEFEIAKDINRWNVIDLHLTAKHLESEQIDIPISEMFFLGGASSLRGYREEQFWGTTVAWTNIEYRYLTGRRSRIFLFNDWGCYYRQEENIDNRNSQNWSDLKSGYGAGIMLETGVGVIGLEFGWETGSQMMEGKVHLRLRTEL
jgi:outer membrane protein insertion porin family